MASQSSSDSKDEHLHGLLTLVSEMLLKKKTAVMFSFKGSDDRAC